MANRHSHKCHAETNQSLSIFFNFTACTYSAACSRSQRPAAAQMTLVSPGYESSCCLLHVHWLGLLLLLLLQANTHVTHHQQV